MLTLKIFNRKVKIRTFKEMLTSEYFEMEGVIEPIKYIALQLNKDVSDLLSVKTNPTVIHRINNIDINSLDIRSLKYQGKVYTDFNILVYGIHYLAESIHKQERENSNLWVFSVALSYKKHGDFDMIKVGVIYNNLLASKAIDVIPIMNYFISKYYKKKAFTIKNLKLFIQAFPTILKTLIQHSFSFIMRKIKYRNYRKSWEKNY